MDTKNEDVIVENAIVENETVEDNNIQPLSETTSNTKINFTKGSDGLYSYTVQYLVAAYLIKFKTKNPELKVYGKDSSGNRYFVSDVNIPEDQNSIMFKLEVYDDVILEFVTSHEVEYAEAKY